MSSRKKITASLLLTAALTVNTGFCFTYADESEDTAASVFHQENLNSFEMLPSSADSRENTGSDPVSSQNSPDAEINDEEISGPDKITVTSGSVISEGGVYYLDPLASEGVVEIRTTQPVTIIGSGIEKSGNPYLTISCEKENADLTICDLKIDNATEMPSNALKFTGSGNMLTLKGKNMLQQCYNDSQGHAIINVAKNTELTIRGDGELYMYKHSYQNAAIGGDENQASGTVKIEGGTLRIMGINGGALIGSDTEAGDVYISGGDIALWADSRQTAIGGYENASGGNVYISGGILSLAGGEVLIGGGKNSDDSGKLHILGGRIVTDRQTGITAEITDEEGNRLTPYHLDLSASVSENGSRSIFLDDKLYYQGTLTYFSYDPSLITTGASTPDTWTAEENRSIALYLTPADHTLTLDDKKFLLKYKEEDDDFSLQALDSDNGNPDNPSETPGNSGSNPGSSDNSNTAGDGSGSSGSGSGSGSNGSGGSGGSDSNGGSSSGGSSGGSSSGSGGSGSSGSNGSGSNDGNGPSGGSPDGTTTNTSGEPNVSTGYDAENPLPFYDVIRDSWYYDCVNYVYQKAIMKGISDTSFAPHSYTTRAMFVTMLNRLDASLSPSVEKANTKDSTTAENSTLRQDGDNNDLISESIAHRFSDVEDNKWYSPAVSWALKNEIIEGTGEREFSPFSDLTREQAAVMLYRYARYRNPSSASEDLKSCFSDSQDISPWAEDAVLWACSQNIIIGDSTGKFRPKAKITRAETAALMQRLENRSIR